jgi:hypothetical protein
VDVSDAARWRLALEDSGLDEEEARLYFFDDSPRLSPASADTLAPGQTIHAGWPPISELDRQSANDARDAFRIAVDREGREPILVWALVRHELEHCRQYKRYGTAISALGHAIDETLERLHPKLPGLYMLYNVMPSEQDANSSASAFSRRVFGTDPCDRLLDSDWAVLVQEWPPADLETVGLRQACFAAVHADALARSPRVAAMGIEPLIAAVAPGIAPTWTEIADDPSLRGLAADAVRASPDWDRCKARTLSAYQRALTLAGHQATSDVPPS